MPIYTYHCKTCNTRFERLCSDYREQLRCPQCSRAAKRVFRPSRFVFKGSGFHSTDYGKFGPRSTSKR